MTTLAHATGLRIVHVAERARWNALVERFCAVDIRQGFEWGELRRCAGWQPLRIAVLDSDRCVAACSVSVRRLPVGGAVMYAPRGPLLDPERPDALARLVVELRHVGRQVAAIVLRVSPGVAAADPLVDALRHGGFRSISDEYTTWNTPRFTQTLDLRGDTSATWTGVRRRLREYVGAAARRGLVIEPSEDERDLEALYPLLLNVARLKGYPIRAIGYYRALVREFRPSGTLTLLVARLGGLVAGGLIAVRLGCRSTMLYTSVRSEVSETLRHHVAPALYWAYILHARAEGCEIADFGPSGVHLTPREADNGYGVYRFKAGFGCRAETFVEFQDLVLRPLLYRVLRASEGCALPALWRLRSAHLRGCGR